MRTVQVSVRLLRQKEYITDYMRTGIIRIDNRVLLEHIFVNVNTISLVVSIKMRTFANDIEQSALPLK
jgi:hypothetical protein